MISAISFVCSDIPAMEEDDDGADHSLDQAKVQTVNHQVVQETVIQHQQMPHAVNQPRQAVSTATPLHAPTSYHRPTQQANDVGNMPRVRQYPSTINGPFTVIIREVQMTIAPLNFAAFINKKYTSVCLIKRSQGKMKVVLNARDEANELARDPYFLNYHVYIPADLVEIEGAICADDLCDLDDLKILISDGKGIFDNMLLSPCDIVHAEHIFRIGDEAIEPPERILTNTVKVTFEGQVLPSHIVIGGLRVKIRPFHKKPMFCVSCQTFGHTTKYCKRKPKCARCSDAHATASCTADNPASTLCPYCLTEHQDDRRVCSFFNEVNESFKVKQSSRRKTRYQQAVAAASRTVNITASAAFEIENAAQFPTLQNRFSALPVEEPTPRSLQSQPPPAQLRLPPRSQTRLLRNPYAKVVSEGSRPSVRARSASKRKWTETNDPKPQPQSSTPRLSRPRENVAPRSAGLSVDPSPTQALKMAIITFARHANVSQIWITLLEAIIDPLLQALLPQLTAIIGALGPSALSSIHQHA